MLLAQSATQTAEAVGTPGATAEVVVFVIFAVIGVAAALAMITLKNIVHSALMLVVNFLSIAAMYLALQSQFLGIVQVIVYAGAIMVLFLFVIMLLGVHRDDLLFDTRRWHVVGAAVAGVAVAAALLFGLGGGLGADSRCGGQAPDAGTGTFRCAGLEQAYSEVDEGSVGFLAQRLFQRYTFPFEAAAVLLVVATMGALVLGRRHDPPAEVDAERPRPPTTDRLPSDADRLVGPPAEDAAGGGGR